MAPDSVHSGSVSQPGVVTVGRPCDSATIALVRRLLIPSGYGCSIRSQAETWRDSSLAGRRPVAKIRPASDGWVDVSSRQTVSLCSPSSRTWQSDMVARSRRASVREARRSCLPYVPKCADEKVTPPHSVRESAATAAGSSMHGNRARHGQPRHGWSRVVSHGSSMRTPSRDRHERALGGAGDERRHQPVGDRKRISRETSIALGEEHDLVEHHPHATRAAVIAARDKTARWRLDNQRRAAHTGREPAVTPASD